MIAQSISHDVILTLMQGIQSRQGRSTALNHDALLRDVGFRSLDFSELALRAEQMAGRTLQFDASSVRRIRTVGDVTEFIVAALAG